MLIVLVTDDTSDTGIRLGLQLECLVLLKLSQTLFIILISSDYLLVELAFTQSFNLLIPSREWLFRVGLWLHAVP